ncbi:MAG: hypothetical protein K2Q22_15695 [Cytophagales bacterium]|nr:hypothetical protein [Cytophagales bacterium]
MELTPHIVQATIGLLLTGSGLCMAIDAGFVRLKKGKWWVLYGTAALIVFNAGICFVIDAAKLAH